MKRSTAPIGAEFLSGPPMGSFEYHLLPQKVRVGFIRSLLKAAVLYQRGQDFNGGQRNENHRNAA